MGGAMFSRIFARQAAPSGLQHCLAVSASDREEILGLKHRIERIERRLELHG